MKAKNILVIALSILSVILLLANEKTASSECISEKNIVSFLKRYGWETDPDRISSENIIIPERFSQVYSEYNNVQILGGFDLRDQKGCRAVLYSCPVLNYADFSEVTAQLTVYNGRLIGADIFCTGENGFIKPINTH